MIKLQSKFCNAYESDASQIKGQSKEVFIPETIEEVQKFVIGNKAITPRGAGTGLVGGCVSNGTCILDISKLNKIISFNKIRKTIEVEAGIILDDLNNFLERFGFEFPINPSSHSVCTIGGMIATNAVGSRAIKYGKTGNWIEWIDIVDAKGRIQRKLKSEISDYIGLEGISGVIIRACLKITETKDRTASLISFDSFFSLIEKVKELKRNPDVSMIEFCDKTISQLIDFPNGYNLLVEFESLEGEYSGEEYFKLLAKRDMAYPLVAKLGYSHIEDPKLFLDKIYELMGWLENNKIPVFGHISVGILHPCFSKDQLKKIPDMMKIVKRLSGQISGEHGIGLLKKQFIEPQDKKLIYILKKRLDPENKFNPGKVVD